MQEKISSTKSGKMLHKQVENSYENALIKSPDKPTRKKFTENIDAIP